MNKQRKISVIIPVYNTAAYLPRCLDSILNNTYKNLEVICINDGSTDGSAAIIKQYVAADPRVVAVDKANAGVSAARNTGLSMATGDFIAFIDSDDWVHPQYFEALSRAQAKTDADITACKYISTGENRCAFPEFDLNTIDAAPISSANAINIGHLKRLVWGRLYKHSLLSGLQFEVGLQWGEDSVFSINALGRSSSVVLIWPELYYYFQRESSASQTTTLHKMLDLVRCYLKNYQTAESDTQRYLYLSESIKEVLAGRYLGMFSLNDSELRECAALIQQCRRKMKESHVLSKKEVLIYDTFIQVPTLYRLFRIVDDPTMLKWEKQVKKKQRAAGRRPQ